LFREHLLRHVVQPELALVQDGPVERLRVGENPFLFAFVAIDVNEFHIAV
jgi:hypothetical protein